MRQANSRKDVPGEAPPLILWVAANTAGITMDSGLEAHVPHGTEVYDPFGWMSGGNFICREAGPYLIAVYGGASTTVTTLGFSAHVNLRKNGTEIAGISSYGSGSTGPLWTFGAVEDLVVDDELSINVFVDRYQAACFQPVDTGYFVGHVQILKIF